MSRILNGIRFAARWIYRELRMPSATGVIFALAIGFAAAVAGFTVGNGRLAGDLEKSLDLEATTGLRKTDAHPDKLKLRSRRLEPGSDGSEPASYLDGDTAGRRTCGIRWEVVHKTPEGKIEVPYVIECFTRHDDDGRRFVTLKMGVRVGDGYRDLGWAECLGKSDVLLSVAPSYLGMIDVQTPVLLDALLDDSWFENVVEETSKFLTRNELAKDVQELPLGADLWKSQIARPLGAALREDLAQVGRGSAAVRRAATVNGSLQFVIVVLSFAVLALLSVRGVHVFRARRGWVALDPQSSWERVTSIMVGLLPAAGILGTIDGMIDALSSSGDSGALFDSVGYALGTTLVASAPALPLWIAIIMLGQFERRSGEVLLAKEPEFLPRPSDATSNDAEEREGVEFPPRLAADRAAAGITPEAIPGSFFEPGSRRGSPMREMPSAAEEEPISDEVGNPVTDESSLDERLLVTLERRGAVTSEVRVSRRELAADLDSTERDVIEASVRLTVSGRIQVTQRPGLPHGYRIAVGTAASEVAEIIVPFGL